MKTSNKQLKIAPEVQDQIFNASNSIRLSDLKREQLFLLMQKALSWLVDFTGNTSLTKEQIDFMLATLVDQVPVDYPYLKKEEFKISIKRGASGEYGEIYTLSAATIYGFIKGFYAEKNQLIKREETKKAKTRDESPTALCLDDYLINNPDSGSYLKTFLKRI